MSSTTGPHATVPAPITADAARSLPLPWTSLVSRDDLVEHVGRHPWMCWHVPGTQSYLLAGPWRNRGDIVEVYESRGDRHRQSLWNALLVNAPEPYGAILVDPSEYRAAPRFYRHVRVGPIEEVLVLRTGTLPGPPVDLTLQVMPFRHKDLSTLLEIDHSAFPWLWRNSSEEFAEYVEAPGVRLWVASDIEEAVGYVGFTELGGWGHIDRLAVRQDRQGRGYGAQLLSWTMRRLEQSGARYVQLSTQGTNARSQALYSGFGFKQTRGGYKLYGIQLSREVSISAG